MNLRLIRKQFTDRSTIGELYVDDALECYTLEDTRRPNGVKVPGKTCIPPGTYSVMINMSQRFKRMMPLLVAVPNFEGVRIHCGNTDADTEGCILVGLRCGVNAIFQSRAAFDGLFARMQRAAGPIKITIEGERDASQGNGCVQGEAQEASKAGS